MGEVTYDENFIREYLKKTIEELHTPFIERRIQSGGHKDNLQECDIIDKDEIIELVEIINENEESMRTLVQLSFYLLEKGQEKAQVKEQEVEELQQRIYDLETQVEFHKQSVHEYQRLYHDSLDKNNKLQDTMSSIENEYSASQKHFESLKNELQKLRVQSQKMGKLEDVENLKQTLLLNQQEVVELKKLLNLTKVDNKQLRDEVNNITKTCERHVKNSEKLEYEIKNHLGAKKVIETQLKDLKEHFQLFEQQCSIQIQEIEQLKRLVNTLEKEQQELVYKASLSTTLNTSTDALSLKDQLKQKNPEEESSPKIVQHTKGEQKKQQMQLFLKAHGNLLSELKEGGDIFNGQVPTQSSPKEKQIKIKLDANNLKTTGAMIQKQQPVRRDPYEEFFMLTTQCVKLNSPFMDDILALDSSQYYKMVLEQYIPFHKWYAWIEDKLHSIRKQLIKKEHSEIHQHQLIQY